MPIISLNILKLNMRVESSFVGETIPIVNSDYSQDVVKIYNGAFQQFKSELGYILLLHNRKLKVN